MATSYADTAAEFGVVPEPDIDPELLKPVRLSPTTRRQVGIMDQAQLDVNTLSMDARIDAKQQAQLLEQDAMEDEAWNRDVDMKTKAVAWNNKVLSQQHGTAALDSMMDLLPTDPEYATKKASIIKQFPLAIADPRINAIITANDEAFSAVEKARLADEARQTKLEDRTADLELRQTQRVENREDQQLATRQNATDTFEQNIRLKVADLSPEAQSLYDEGVAAGKSPIDAFRQAKQISRAEVSIRDAAEAGRQQTAIKSQLSKLQELLVEAYDPQQKESIQAEIDNLSDRWQLEDEIVKTYRATKNIKKDPKAAEKPAPADKPAAAPSTVDVTKLTNEQKAEARAALQARYDAAVKDKGPDSPEAQRLLVGLNNPVLRPL
jgi:hypothetical protein